MTDEQRVFVRGVKGRGEEVIKTLEDLGAKNYQLDGANTEYLYFINHEGSISLALLDSEFGKIIIDNYHELYLPENWKDGDVLVSRSNSQVMVLYDFVSDKDADLFNTYFRLDRSVIFLHSLEVRNRFRLATDQEIERFYENLHKLHKEWDAEKKHLVDWRWKPKKEEDYWAVILDTTIIKLVFTWLGSVTDEIRYKLGNCFRTREEAEAAAERVKRALKGE